MSQLEKAIKDRIVELRKASIATEVLRTKKLMDANVPEGYYLSYAYALLVAKQEIYEREIYELNRILVLYGTKDSDKNEQKDV